MGGAIATLALPISSGESLGFTDPSTNPGYGYSTTTSVGPTTVTAVTPGGTHGATMCSATSPVVSSVLGGGSNLAAGNGPVGGVGYYEILLVKYSCSTTNCASGGTLSSVSQTFTAPNITSTCSTTPPCWWYEMSGFFGGAVNATDYTQNTDNGVLVFTANLNAQPAWRPQGYGWNYLEGATPTVLVPWGAAGTPFCEWNEHFHISNNGSMMTWASTNGNTAWAGSCAGDPGTPPLDLWSTPLWYYKDAGGYLQATTLLEGTGQATRLTYFNQPGSPDSTLLCALTPCTGPLDFSGGSGIYGPYDTYYVLSNAQTVGQSAILDLPVVALRTRVNGTSSVGGTSTIQ
jgi:hypothetical protein